MSRLSTKQRRAARRRRAERGDNPWHIDPSVYPLWSSACVEGAMQLTYERFMRQIQKLVLMELRRRY
jgi:hypothetical protein